MRILIELYLKIITFKEVEQNNCLKGFFKNLINYGINVQNNHMCRNKSLYNITRIKVEK